MGFDTVAANFVLLVVFIAIASGIVSFFIGYSEEMQERGGSFKRILSSGIDGGVEVEDVVLVDGAFAGGVDQILIYVRNQGSRNLITQGCLNLYLNSTFVDLQASDFTFPDNETGREEFGKDEVVRINASGLFDADDGISLTALVDTCEGVKDSAVRLATIDTTTTTTLPDSDTCDSLCVKYGYGTGGACSVGKELPTCPECESNGCEVPWSSSVSDCSDGEVCVCSGCRHLSCSEACIFHEYGDDGRCGAVGIGSVCPGACMDAEPPQCLFDDSGGGQYCPQAADTACICYNCVVG